MKQWYNMQIGIIMLSFSHQKCYSNNPAYKRKAWKLKNVILNMATSGNTSRKVNPDALGVLMLPDILARHSAYYATGAFIKNLDGCDNPVVQVTLKNLIDLIVYRDPVKVRARHKKRHDYMDTIDLPLASQKITLIQVDRPYGYYKDKRKKQIFRNMLDRILYGDDSMLQCVYTSKTYKKNNGPSKIVHEELGSDSYTFWYKRVPLTEEELKVVPGTSGWRNLGVIALESCPETRLEAEKIRKKNWETWKYSKRRR